MKAGKRDGSAASDRRPGITLNGMMRVNDLRSRRLFLIHHREEKMNPSTAGGIIPDLVSNSHLRCSAPTHICAYETLTIHLRGSPPLPACWDCFREKCRPGNNPQSRAGGREREREPSPTESNSARNVFSSSPWPSPPGSSSSPGTPQPR